MLKYFLFFMIFCFSFIKLHAQVDPPSGYTSLGFRLYDFDDNPGSDSLNANWQDVNNAITSMLIVADPRYFAWINNDLKDTLTLNALAFGTIGFGNGENLYLPYHDPPYSNFGGGAIAYTSGGYLVMNNSSQSRIDTFVTEYDIGNSVVLTYGNQSITGVKTINNGTLVIDGNSELVIYGKLDFIVGSRILLPTNSGIGDYKSISVVGGDGTSKIGYNYGTGLADSIASERHVRTYVQDIPGLFRIPDSSGAGNFRAIQVEGGNGAGFVTFNYGTGMKDTLAGLRILRSTPGVTYDSIRFNPNSNRPVWSEGTIFYDSISKSLAYYNNNPEEVVNIDQEGVVPVYNASAVTINRGNWLTTRKSSAVSNRSVINVQLALASQDSLSDLVGAASQEILPGSYGFAINDGFIENINTSAAYQENINIFLSATVPGGWVDSIESAPNNIVKAGIVTKKHATEGVIYAMAKLINFNNGESAFSFSDSSIIILLPVISTQYRITNAGNNLFTFNTDIANNMSLSGDTLYVENKGVYYFWAALSFSGENNGRYVFSAKHNDADLGPVGIEKRADVDESSTGFLGSFKANAGDYITFWVKNTDNTTSATIISMSVIVKQAR